MVVVVGLYVTVDALQSQANRISRYGLIPCVKDAYRSFCFLFCFEGILCVIDYSQIVLNSWFIHLLHHLFRFIIPSSYLSPYLISNMRREIGRRWQWNWDKKVFFLVLISFFVEYYLDTNNLFLLQKQKAMTFCFSWVFHNIDITIDRLCVLKDVKYNLLILISSTLCTLDSQCHSHNNIRNQKPMIIIPLILYV